MAQLLRNGLPDEFFKIILKETRFMYSIRTVDKRWNESINKVIRKEAENRLKKLCIEYDASQLSTRGLDVEYESLRKSFVINIEDDNFAQLIGLIHDDTRQREVKISFHYDNGATLAEFNFGTLQYRRLRSLNGRSEIQQNMIHKSCDDCELYFEIDPTNTDSFYIKIEKLVMSLKKMCVILDLLNG
ncbi:2724_t:CDS:2 [Funneliformis geosporum]|nr:2724_t:CDS:2 [Funneliformis geosporum]